MNIITILSSVAIDTLSLGKIEEDVSLLKHYSEPTILDYWVSIASIVSCILAFSIFFTFINHARKNRISKKCQKALFDDFLRHMYRNKVAIEASMRMWKEKGIDKVYPSEAVFLKCQFLPEDLNFSRFANGDRYLNRMHEIELHLRNYNIVCTVAAKHIREYQQVTEMVIQLYSRADQITLMAIQLADKLHVGPLSCGWEQGATNINGMSEQEVFEADVLDWIDRSKHCKGTTFFDMHN